MSDGQGRFKFGRIAAGTYTLIVFLPGRGESRSTVDIGPGTANERGRVTINARVDESRLTPDHSGRISVAQLSIPARARREYDAAEKKLRKNDAGGAVAHLKKAVEIAPQFSAAWNHLGTIAYKAEEYDDAAKYFRTSLEADPAAYEPLVNLGGVLLNLGKPDEAYTFNMHAVLQRPQDALANSQMGMTYAALGKADLAVRYLDQARRLDPGHFSHPQLLLAEIYLRRRQNREAALVLDEFLRYHPDWPAAERMREAIRNLRE